MNTNALDISSFCKTKTQANYFSTHLATVTGKIYETSFDLERVLHEAFDMKRKDLLLALLHKENINTEAAAEIKSFFLKIQETITALPVVTLTLAFEPQEKTLQVLSDWFAMNLKKHVLFDIEVDPGLIAGAKIKYKGSYADYSLKPLFDKMLDEFLSQNQTKEQKPKPQIGDNFSLGR